MIAPGDEPSSGWRLREKKLIEELAVIPGPEDRWAELMRLGRRYGGLEEACRIDRFRVPGCVSQVWILPEVHDGLIRFRFAADSGLVQGLVWLACRIAGGDRPGCIQDLDINALAALDLDQRLSPTRERGFQAVQRALCAWDRLVDRGEAGQEG
ncbi:MAG: SufE family protein [Opitutales bacterium]